jgi:hypothetical protein
MALNNIADNSPLMYSEMRYKPCPTGMLREGEVRHENGVTVTNHTYTGQHSNVSDFGLMYYRARWMDPQLGGLRNPIRLFRPIKVCRRGIGLLMSAIILCGIRIPAAYSFLVGWLSAVAWPNGYSNFIPTP